MEGAPLETEGNIKQEIRNTPEPNSLRTEETKVSHFDPLKSGPSDASFLLSSVVKNLKMKKDGALDLANPSAETVKEYRDSPLKKLRVKETQMEKKDLSDSYSV
mmetsp:Transcript_10025/g.15233  ORF Transcript_10025/g.15233 Transcript_10025/m.15233 type:complete len:104 (-) Transcript_10025:8-319(-)